MGAVNESFVVIVVREGTSGALEVNDTAVVGDVTTAAPLLALFTSQGLGGEGIFLFTVIKTDLKKREKEENIHDGNPITNTFFHFLVIKVDVSDFDEMYWFIKSRTIK